ncbi:ComF family protein [Jeongeupia naejangsanensis]|uniref:ComF family protein n=1 Tax=Jeongeupia naejangsanensis TaxID=613195 RepID=A0ABS2BGQ4_9NEIS|nr:ComF family protein [Jeongeupia naejangsanensis]MBM3114640.1 ComF family protein [Jeongeupia naejangsanensis]
MRFLNKIPRLPVCCALCHRSCHSTLCDACDAALPRLPTHCCPRCALPTHDGGLCGGCLAHPPRFDASHAVLRYTGEAAHLITAGKYAGRWPLWRALASLLVACLPAAPDVDLIMPMPLHPHRLRERGFNQSAELAAVISRHAGLPLRHDLLERVRDTTQQSRLSLPERRRNLKGAFAAVGQLQGMRIAVVDDVMTSGLTLDAVAATLKRAGAARVEAWVLARTL